MLSTGTVAVLAVYILQFPELGTVEIGNALEWIFYVLLPNFCFNRALQDVYLNYQFQSVCRTIDDLGDRATFCQAIKMKNMTNICCSGQFCISLYVLVNPS
jgi:ATP-binding cassette, subfamily A (ABC1), member 3